MSGARVDVVVEPLDVARRHLPTAGYAGAPFLAAEAARLGGAAVVVRATAATSSVVVPLLEQVSDVAGRRVVDVTSPYGYSGVLSRGLDREGATALALAALHAIAARRRWVTAFLRLDPRTPWDSACGRTRGTTTVDHGPSAWLATARDGEEQAAAYRPRLRSQVRRLVAEGHEVRSDPAALDAWWEVYERRMDHYGAGPVYRFPLEGLRAWLADDPTARLWTLWHDGELLCGKVVVEDADAWHYHLGATHPDHLRRGPAKLLMHELGVRAARAGVGWLHLGGGRGGSRDGLWQLKSGFAARVLPLRTVRVVLDATRHAELAARSGASTWFPSHRDPAGPTPARAVAA